MYPSISEKSVAESIELCKRNHIENRLGETVDEFMNNLKNRSKVINDKDLVKSLIVYRDNKDLLTDESIEVVNKLLGDTKIRNKIRIVYDGSYLVNRIWGSVDLEKGKIALIPEFSGYEIDVESSKFDNLSLKKKIDYLYNHFDTIYLQINLVKSVLDIIEIIEFELLSGTLDRIYDYDPYMLYDDEV
jgi:hypothetical protein